MKMITLTVLFCLLAGAIPAQSCDSLSACDCAATDISPAGSMLTHSHARGSWKISYTYMQMLSDGAISGTSTLSDMEVYNSYIMSPQTMQMDMHMMMAMYGFTERFSAMLMVNYTNSSMRMEMLPGMQMQGMTGDAGTEMKTHTHGFGDTKLWFVYNVLRRNASQLMIDFGLSLPTGSIRQSGKADDPAYPSSRFPYMMQNGSGTLDLMPALTYLLKKEKFSASAQLIATVRPVNNALGYHLGNELLVNAWAAYRWLPWISTSLRGCSASMSRISGSDPQLVAVLEPADDPANYGGTTVSVFCGLNFYLNHGILKNNRIAIEYGIPCYQNANGVQLTAKSTFYAGWLYSF